MIATPEIGSTADNAVAPLDVASLFSKSGKLEIDVGAGEGSFLLAMAQRFPETNFLGIERMARRVRALCRGAERLRLGNVRVLRLESGFAVRSLIPPDSVSTLHISYPDPWPKRRHWPRRLITPEFIESALRVLQPGGEIRVVTDHAEYFQHIQRTMRAFAPLQEMPWPRDPDYPRTYFETRLAHLPVYRLRLRKV